MQKQFANTCTVRNVLRNTLATFNIAHARIRTKRANAARVACAVAAGAYSASPAQRIVCAKLLTPAAQGLDATLVQHVNATLAQQGYVAYAYFVHTSGYSSLHVNSIMQ